MKCDICKNLIGFIETKCCYESVVEASNRELRTLVSELRIENLKLRYEVTELKKGTRLKFQEEANLKLRFQISKLENKNQEGRDTIDVLTKKNEELKRELSALTLSIKAYPVVRAGDRFNALKWEEMQVEIEEQQRLIHALRFQIKGRDKDIEILKEENFKLNEQAKVDKELNANWICCQCHDKLRENAVYNRCAIKIMPGCRIGLPDDMFKVT